MLILYFINLHRKHNIAQHFHPLGSTISYYPYFQSDVTLTHLTAIITLFKSFITVFLTNYFLTNNLNYLHYPEKDVPVVTASPLHRTSHGVTASSAKAELTMLADLLGESVRRIK